MAFSIVGILAITIRVMHNQAETLATAGCCPLEHLQVTVGIAKAAMGRRPMNFWIPNGPAGTSIRL